jgi:hypothetical protein
MDCYCQSGWTCPECTDALTEKVRQLKELVDTLEAELKEYQEIEVKPERKSLVGEEPF